MTVYLVTHPEVEVDPTLPVPRWRLSAAGRVRLQHLRSLPWAGALTKVVSSTEVKAVQTAEALAEPLGLEVLVDAMLGENDRSATGFVPPVEFERLADAFFASPTINVRGWERAVDAQSRFVAAVGRAVRGVEGDVARWWRTAGSGRCCGATCRGWGSTAATTSPARAAGSPSTRQRAALAMAGSASNLPFDLAMAS